MENTSTERTAGRPGAEPHLYEQLADILAREIACGQIDSGARVYESHVAARFGVSRAPARQALALLADTGVIEPAGGNSRGFVVLAANGPAASDSGRARPAAVGLAIRPTWERIYGEVEEAIASRIVFGSWKINETVLGEYFGVSRTVAREVLGRLQSRGLVVSEGKRWIAPELTERRVTELYEMRAILESAALRSAGPNFPVERLRDMRRALVDALETAPSGDELDRLEVELHVEFLQSCGNEMLRSAMRQYQVLLLAHRFFYRLTARLFDEEPFLREHLSILEKVLEGRFDEAGCELQAHLFASQQRAATRIARVRSLVRHEPLSFLQKLPPQPS